MIIGRRPRNTPARCIISRYVSTSVPPISTIVCCSVRWSVRPWSRYVTTSPTAIGWDRVATHLGVTITGKRFTRSMSMRKDVLPAPMTIPARNSRTGGP